MGTPLATSTDYTDWKAALLAVVFAEDMNRGGVYIYDWLRWGLITQEDAYTIRDLYIAYKTTTQARPNFTPNHPDKGTAVHGFEDITGNPATMR